MQLMLRATIAAGLLTVASATFGQTVDTGVPPPPANVTIAPPTCEKPPTKLPPGRDSTAEVKRYDKALDAYKTCITAYFRALGDEAKAYAAVATTLNDAGNNTINEFNAFAAEVRKNRDADDE